MVRCAVVGVFILHYLLESNTLHSLPSAGGRCRRPLSSRYGPDLFHRGAGPDLWRDGSSVSCRGSERADRHCTFRNLCYWPRYNDFVFFHGEDTSIVGLPFDRSTPFLDSSSVVGHNTLFFNVVDLPASVSADLEVDLHRGMHLIFKRFNPENLMHVLHDDLLPVFATLSHHCNLTPPTRKRHCGQPESSICDVKVVLADGRPKGPYFEWLTLLYSHQLYTVDDFRSLGLDRLSCFERAVVGLDKSTTWYQYGFGEGQLQGPLENSMASGAVIRHFSRYLFSRAGLLPFRPRPLETLISALDTKETTSGQFSNSEERERVVFTLISRSENRRIVNEDGVVRTLATSFGARVKLLRLERASIREILKAMRTTTLLIGMHGSALALAMFLPRGAAVLELFPFAIQPSDFTPYATLTKLKGMSLEYRAWVNRNESLTITHPDWPENLGGIRHLPKEEQDIILNSDHVRPKPCCYHPEWLFRIYQDTIVDIPSLLDATRDLITAMAKLQSQLHGGGFLQMAILPGQVQSVKCIRVFRDGRASFAISWKPPWNEQYILRAEQDLWYEVFVQTLSKSHEAAYKLQATSFSLPIDGVKLQGNEVLFVWVRATVEHLGHGPFGHHISCDIG